MGKLSDAYKTIIDDPFPPAWRFRSSKRGRPAYPGLQKALYEVEGERKGLRYGENPDQAAALYKLVGGNLTLADAMVLEPGEGLVSAAELLQFGKHPARPT
jgi:phosphoribosylaminoimidazolecarboxamide formyltransferase/IMP cyclohydrolase